MVEVMDILVLLALAGLVAFLGYLQRIIIQVESRLNEVVNSKDDISFDFTKIKDEMLDIVESTIENMTPPSAFDHIAGAVSQYFNMKMMKEFKLEQMAQSLPEIITDEAQD